MKRSLVWLLAAGGMLGLSQVAASGEPDPGPSFFRGLNLNGPSVTIDGHTWGGMDSKTYVCDDKPFDNQHVELVPPTDPERAKMLRSSRWGGNRIELTDIPSGEYTVFLYVWEDNDSETYSVTVNTREVLPRHHSGQAGHWDKLGPWYVTTNDGKIVLTSKGGAANFSGIEIWNGRHDGQDMTPITEEQLAFFESRIRPLLVEKCYECHSEQVAEPEGDLLVDSRPTLRRGGINGPAIVPGNVEKSLLIAAVKYDNEEMQMPPDGKLSDEQIADLVKWVEMGAPDPRAKATKATGKQIDIAAAREFWSLQSITDPPVPEVQNTRWPVSDIDRFILSKLESNGLQPAADADKRALIRRATYDLTGLPPTSEEVNEFLADDSEQAFENVIERLLASPSYGERWGRHWLDVVRYADTAGDNSDYPVPQLHRYRDWVIAAFNRDLPYDEFVRDQLAGDLRGGATEQERYDRIVATGYIANSRRFGSRVDDYPQHLTIEDTLDNLGRTFLGMTLSCARCHDHKFDPITTRDYYGLYGIFHSTRYPWPGIELDKNQRDFVILLPEEKQAEARQMMETRDQEIARLSKVINDNKEARKGAEGDEKAKLGEAIERDEKALSELRNQPLPFDMVYAVAEGKRVEDVPVQQKGDPMRAGDMVHRRFPTVFGGEELPENYPSSGRVELAEWILKADNPLPARVMANRIWQHHFGKGIVPTPNDFGKQGKPPAHPELLDYLATRFRENGWSIKSMHRLIMLSRSYRQAASRSETAIANDPNNELLAGYPRRRLDAESVRDTLLVLGGNLDTSPAGPHPFPPPHTWGYTQHKPFKDVYESNRRSVYLMTQRIQRHPYLSIFDGADPSASTPARMTSTTPLQALFLLNDPFVHEQARLIAEQIQAKGEDDQSRVAFAYEFLLSRPVRNDERSAALKFLADARSLLAEDGVATDQIEAETWKAYVRTLFRLNEFVYLD